ncbi:MAG TPA: hypothetical protein VKG24_31105 [Pseudolabrys sp.]|nr:hypothetical protein [Pseudolabrys sp.]
MTAITYGSTRVSSARTKRAEVAAPRKNLFVRFMDALAESRLKHAHQEILKHSHLLPQDRRDILTGGR